MPSKLAFYSAPHLILLVCLLSSCTNREILHGSSSDRPPSLKVAKKPISSKLSGVDKSEPDSKSLKEPESEKHLESDKKENATESKETTKKKSASEPVSNSDSDLKADSKPDLKTESSKSLVEKPLPQGKIRIWFSKVSRGSTQPYAVERSISKTEPIRDAVVQLLHGPTAAEEKLGVKTEIPVGTVLIGVTKKANVVELNLSRRFGAGGVDSIETRLQQLELTVKEAAGSDKVYLDVEGKRLTTAGEGLDVKQPLN